jgi:hypothetical protein
MVNTTPQLLYPLEGYSVLNVKEARWARGLVWMGVENLSPLGFDPLTLQPVVSQIT